jgi:O-antigen/teichoic acid export membrane protein
MIRMFRERMTALVRFGERSLKTDLQYVVRGGFWLTSGHAFASVSAFILSIIFANFVDPATYGTYKYALSLAALLSIPTLGSITTALQRAIAKGDDGAAYAALKARLWGGVAAAALSLLASLWYFGHGNATLGMVLVIIALGMPLMESYGSYDAIFQGKHRYRASTFSFIFSSLTATLALIAAIFVSSGNVHVLLAAYFIAWAAGRFVSWQVASRLLTKDTERNPGEVTTYGFRLTAIGVVGAIAAQVDGVLLFHYLGPVELAIFSFATALPNQLRGVVSNIARLALSRFSSRSAEEIKTSIHTKAFYLFLASLPIVAAYILAAPFIFQLLFPAYLSSVLPSQVFALSIVAVPAFLYVTALQSQRAEKLFAINDIAGSFLQIALSMALIPLFGLWGAIIARILGRFIGTIGLAFSIRFLK